MIKTRYLNPIASVLLLSAASLHAQGGCTDSPEAPTALLMLIGMAGMVYGSSVLRKMLSRAGNQ